MAWLHTMGQAGEDDGELDTTHTVSSFLVFLSSKPGEGRWLGIARSLRNHSDSGSCPTALVRLLLRSAHKPCWRVPFAFFLESALNSQAVSLYNLWSSFFKKRFLKVRVVFPHIQSLKSSIDLRWGDWALGGQIREESESVICMYWFCIYFLTSWNPSSAK